MVCLESKDISAPVAPPKKSKKKKAKHCLNDSSNGIGHKNSEKAESATAVKLPKTKKRKTGQSENDGQDRANPKKPKLMKSSLKTTDSTTEHGLNDSPDVYSENTSLKDRLDCKNDQTRGKKKKKKTKKHDIDTNSDKREKMQRKEGNDMSLSESVVSDVSLEMEKMSSMLLSDEAAGEKLNKNKKKKRKLNSSEGSTNQSIIGCESSTKERLFANCTENQMNSNFKEAEPQDIQALAKRKKKSKIKEEGPNECKGMRHVGNKTEVTNVRNGLENNKATILKCVENSHLPKKKKKSKKLKTNNDSDNSTEPNQGTCTPVEPVNDSDVLAESLRPVNLCSDSLNLPSKKKRKSKVTDCTNGFSEKSEIICEREIPCQNEIVSVKKKKSKNKSCPLNGLVQPQLIQTQSDESLKKAKVSKKKKKPKDSSLDTVSSDSVSNTTLQTAHNDTETPACGKKKKRKSEPKEPKTNVEAPGSQDDELGQWKTANLPSKTQEKFARLLGARKSSKTVSPLVDLKDGESVLSRLTGVWNPPQGRLFGSLRNDRKFSSMAMDQTQTEKLNEALESQYSKTLEFNLQKRKEGNKAKGLGFQEDPAKGKKNYIDVNKVNSVQLD